MELKLRQKASSYNYSRSDKENFLIHGELTETNKGLLFFSELGGNLNFRHFSFKPLMLKLTKLDTKRLKLSLAMFEDTVKSQLLRIHCLRLRVHA